MPLLNARVNAFQNLFGQFTVRKLVLAKDLSGLEPVDDFFGAELDLTGRAELLYLSGLGVASLAEVVEEEGYPEVVRNDAALVFADVLRAELELARLDVAFTLLDERGIEHNAE